VTITLDFANASGHPAPPATAFHRWIDRALAPLQPDAALALRILDAPAMTALNRRFRQQDKPTNVLAFPVESAPPAALDHLGDIAICAALAESEAQAQSKPLEAHYAHLSIHGALHLAGLDHADEPTAAHMEVLETQILQSLGFACPYS